MSRRAVVRISMEMIHQLLDLPDEVEILHSTIGNYGLTLDLIITAPEMAEVDPLAVPPTVHPTYQGRNGVAHLVSLDYPREQKP